MSTTHETLTLYRFYGLDDTLLYVGMTVNPGRRMEKHRGTKDWWCDVARIEMEQFTSLDELRVAERRAIETERPLHNIRMNSGRHRGAKPLRTRDQEPVPAGLIGRWFHSYVPLKSGAYRPQRGRKGDLQREWQGQFVARDGDLLICQLYSWWDGSPSSETVVHIDRIADWDIFPTNQAMRIADGCMEYAESTGEARCGAPCTHVIWDFPLGPIFRCGDCIEHYSGKAERL